VKDSSLKQVVEYIFPPALLDIARACRGHIGHPCVSGILSANLVQRDKHRGESVYILGNGPSLNSVDRRVFRGRKVIVMNSFHRSEWKNEVEIVAHCLGEPRDSPSWSADYCTESINGTDSASYWIHFSSYKRFSEVKSGKNVYFVFPNVEPGLWRPRRKINLHSPTLGFQTTAQLAIQVALYLGFVKIMLLGFDHDWLASPKFSPHFYSREKDPDDTLSQHSYRSIIEFTRRMWIIYYKLKEVSISHGAGIYNMTERSYLDVFERASPSD
jgi:hypothetical protein